MTDPCTGRPFTALFHQARDELAQSLAFFPFATLVPASIAVGAHLCKLRVDCLMHHTKISTPIWTTAQIKKIGALQFQDPERFLPIIRESIRCQPDEHSVKWPL
jgi:hypothetical protein